MSRTFIFILLILLPLTSRSQTVEVEGIVYEIDTTIDEAKVVNANKCTISDYVSTVFPGDVNDNGSLNIDDVTALINYLLSHNTTINEANADVDGDGRINISDVTSLINLLLTGGN